MRKLFFSTFVVLAAIFMAACSSNSPKAAAEAYSKAIIKGDYKTALEYVYMKGEPEEVQKKKEFYLQMVENKVKDGLPEDKQMTKFEVISEEFDEDETHATVVANVTYANGNTKEERSKMIKTEDGKWMVDGEK